MTAAIGAMRTRIALQSPERVADELGGAAIHWAHEGEAWAHVVALGAAADAAFDGVVTTATFRIEIYRREDVRSGWRVLSGGRVLTVDGVVDDGGPRMGLLCTEERR